MDHDAPGCDHGPGCQCRAGVAHTDLLGFLSDFRSDGAPAASQASTGAGPTLVAPSLGSTSERPTPDGPSPERPAPSAPSGLVSAPAPFVPAPTPAFVPGPASYAPAPLGGPAGTHPRNDPPGAPPYPLASYPGYAPLAPVGYQTPGAPVFEKPARTGRGLPALAKVGLGAGAALTLLAVAAVAIPTLLHAKSGVSQYEHIQAGQCFNTSNPDSSGIDQNFSVVSCAGEHSYQSVGDVMLTGSSWPGTAGIRTQAVAGCASEARAFLTGTPPVGMQLDFFFPDQNAWDLGHHLALCLVGLPGGTPFTGSLGN
jgi:hypothetical protein